MGPMPGRSALCRILLGICVACLYPGCQGSTFNISLSTETFVRDCVGRENEKFFVLSFDDGPASYTEPILDVLKEKGVPATFFLIGSQFERFPESSEKYKELILRMLEEGHIPANHGIDNDEFTLDDVEACHETIASITDGYKMKYFRPAQGAYTIEKYEELIERNYKMIMWNLDIQDWRKEKSTETMLEEVKMAVKNSTFLPPEDDTANHDLPRRGSYIMLAHDNQGKMLQIVPGGQTLLATMIDVIRNAGYEIVSLDDCLAGVAVPESNSTDDTANWVGEQRVDEQEEDWDWYHLQNSSSSGRTSFLAGLLSLIAYCSLAHLS
mmetsp:Transcript_41102/g.124171  ORF Transcript_41102/g.124171 Transcript_41102/m.124171 type:complete len:325 (-) Transcript_41102:243-1217(-)